MTAEPKRRTGKVTRLAPAAELWLVDLARASAVLARQEEEAPRLGPRDRQAIEALRHADVRQRHLTAHLALRILFERRLGRGVRRQDLERPPGAKPRLSGSLGPLDFSLAHAESEALIGITRAAAIGVDLEHVRPVRIAGARRRRILAAGAALVTAAGIDTGSEEEAFMRAWVRLEALAKAQGAGLARTLAALGLRQARAGDSAEVARSVRRQLSLTGLRVHDLALGPGRVAAVAIDAKLRIPPLKTFPVAAAGIEKLLRAQAPGDSRQAC
jgi:4'-phosphopantetheinyl transferase